MVNRELTVLKGMCTKAMDWDSLKSSEGRKLGKEKARCVFSRKKNKKG
jgi:hypothetical protein